MSAPAGYDSAGMAGLALDSREWLDFLVGQSGRLPPAAIAPRPWHWRELHNPWSRAAVLQDAWGFLDLCGHLASLGPVRSALGDDIVLFDSFWLPDPWEPGRGGWRTDRILFPVEPLQGLTVLCACAPGSAVEFRIGARRVELDPGAGVAFGPDCWYRVDADSGDARPGRPLLFGARLFPATSLYLRDAGHPAHIALMEYLPLFNFAAMPLWQVAGEDRADNDFVTGFRTSAPYWSVVGSRPAAFMPGGSTASS